MIVKLNERAVVTYETEFKFPLYRKELMEDEVIYWKFENHHKATKIHEKVIETTIQTLNDNKVDWVQELMSHDLFFGEGGCSIIKEEEFTRSLDRLIQKIYKC